jgi:hypothetical protein
MQYQVLTSLLLQTFNRLSRKDGTNPRAMGIDQRALGTNPKAKKFAVTPSGLANGLEAPKRVALRADSDDEFGDDGLDDFDLQAAEVAATQSIQQTANSLLPVRTRYP